VPKVLGVTRVPKVLEEVPRVRSAYPSTLRQAPICCRTIVLFGKCH